MASIDITSRADDRRESAAVHRCCAILAVIESAPGWPRGHKDTVERRKTIPGLVLLALAASGCSTSNQFVVADYEARPNADKYPPLSLYSMTPRDEFRLPCEEHHDSAVLNYCVLNELDIELIRWQFTKSGLFERAIVADPESDYQLLVSTARYGSESAADLGTAAVAGATLMLLPLNVDYTIKVDAVLTWRGLPLDEFAYELPATISVHVSNAADDFDDDLAQSVGSHLIRDLQKRNSFAPSVLHRSISSADYTEDLQVPEELHGFLKQDVKVFRDPLYGSVVRYSNDAVGYGGIDVFVYPVRATDWEDERALLEQESKSLRLDMDLMRKEGAWAQFELGEDEWLDGPGAEASKPVLRFSGVFANAEMVPFDTWAYLAIREDKFVKVRASMDRNRELEPDIERFVKALLDEITVPEESLFMARARKAVRDESLLPGQ